MGRQAIMAVTNPMIISTTRNMEDEAISKARWTGESAEPDIRSSLASLRNLLWIRCNDIQHRFELQDHIRTSTKVLKWQQDIGLSHLSVSTRV